MALNLASLQSLIETRNSTAIIVLEKFSDGGEIICEVSTFQEMTVNATSLTYKELSALPMASTGWQKYFDDWKAQGLIE